jgi:hypothetical protein
LRRIGIKSRLFLNLKTPERAEFEFNPETNHSELNIDKQNTTDDEEEEEDNENQVENEHDTINEEEDQDCEDDEDDEDDEEDEGEEEEIEDEEIEDEEGPIEVDNSEHTEESNEKKPAELIKNKFGTLLKLATDYYTWEDNTPKE